VRQWRLTAAADRTLPNRFIYSRVSPREQSLGHSHTVITSQTVRRLIGRAWGRRPVRGVTSEEGKSGLEARRASSPGIRHLAHRPAGYRTDSWLSFEPSKATAASSERLPENPIFHAVEPGADPRPAPVSRRYEPAGNAVPVNFAGAREWPQRDRCRPDRPSLSGTAAPATVCRQSQGVPGSESTGNSLPRD
jgi:hypothetical protein